MKTKYLITIFLVLLLAIGVTGAAFASPTSNQVTGAISTTDNPGFVGPGSYVNQACHNGQGVNCNIYADKRDVWFSGLPVSAAIGAGEYFFAVLVPGGQGGNDNPNDGTEKNLSDDYDAYTNRTFSVDGNGNITAYAGTHLQDGNLLQLFPYADTTNPGGEYILAVCELTDGYPVNPDNCKYDAFKVRNGTLAQDLVISKTATPAFDRTYGWSIEKNVNQTLVKQSGVDATFEYTVVVAHNAGDDSNWQVTGKITVANPNLFDVAGVKVTDAVNNGGVCVVTGGEDLTVPGEGSVVLDYTCTYDAAPTTIIGVNTAEATWYEGADKHVSFDKDFSFDTPTGLIDECVDVTDSMVGFLGRVCVGDPNPTVFTYSKTVTGVPGTCTSFDNTATFTATDTGAAGSAGQSVKVCVGADLTVSKTAVPFFTRTYAWDLTKAVDKTLVKQVGGSAVFNYTVDAWQTGFTDSDWFVKGEITVANPNDWQEVSANLSDAVDNGGTCTLDQTTVTVPASSQVAVGYTCTFASGLGGLNTAAASWDSALYYTPNGLASGSAGFEFVTPTTKVLDQITVTDTFAGQTTVLGTLTAVDAAPFAAASFTYSRSIPVPTWACTSYTNTAVIAETGQSDSETVTVCGPIKTGALTMGFWQNKNGQAIIGTYSGENCQSLRTWLNGFAPFSDLAATNCSGVKGYVTTVIKAANASGASMNAMLKAQMLATALDVYFSDPALGGNRINAPTPIGGVTIDLTMICTDMTCTAFQDSSSVFGGTPKTVLEMLTYAASQSDAGGVLWYGNDKATQELAKDAFDAINNETVFAP